MMRRLSLTGTVGLILACGPFKRTDVADSEAVTIDAEADPGDPVFTASLDGSGLQVDIENGLGTYVLGMAETSGGPDPWTGEDCLRGFPLGSGELLLYCHPMADWGIHLSTVDSASQIHEGETTLLSVTQEPIIAYVAFEGGTDRCWVWGANASTYYAGQGCTEQP